MIVDKLKSAYHFFIPFIADIYYGFPGKKMIVVGITGTKGKTTTCRYVASALASGGDKVGVLSTVEFQIGDKRILNDKKMSMLGRGQIQKMMAEMVKAGCKYAVIETSSEGIKQFRHLGVHYDIAIFTNLGTEHNERHGGFENLKRDKSKLFASLSAPRKIINGKKVEKVIVANVDDGHSSYYLGFPADRKMTYSVSSVGVVDFANTKAENITSSDIGVDFVSNGQKYHLNIAGEFNVYNALPAIAIGRLMGLSDMQLASGIASVKKLEGRMEFVEAGQDFKFIVDYAHEPISYAALFTAMRKMSAPHQARTIALIGSDGGGRDVGKRRQMGQVAGELCDFVIVTDVNCFDEDPRVIAEMLAGGARTAGKIDGRDLFVEIDRRKAIELAVSLAKRHDVIAITAKGTEPYICVAKGQKIPWSDSGAVLEVLRNHLKTK